ncbi:polysaccharide pyruvyl transferase CsaB [Gorillibacterium timonense]|uniref:polysaccharide pyruvyl transferase CsaB n=1 Tax=Gorillibacterium timonense TaxID=1689269 RepID=UPI00071C7D12|nr:polysaccharide pyruvyl transferase CsaB [Gorillibacterium timonense]
MGRAVHQLVLSGYYGFHNSGDEAVLQSILLALEAEAKRAGIAVEPIVLSGDPAWTEKMYGVRAVHRMKPAEVLSAVRKADGLISGGGSLLQDATGKLTIPYYLAILKLAQWLGKPTFIYSQGIGPVGQRAFFGPIRRTFSRCQYVSVRDRESAELLRRMGLTAPVDIVPDPVMGLPLRSAAEDGRLPDSGTALAAGLSGASQELAPVIGVSVRFWNADRSELAAIAEALNRLRRERRVEVRFLPFHLPDDEEASREVVRLMGAEDAPDVRIADGLDHPQAMLAAVGECSLLIGMRLHSLIYAASQHVPVAGISYDPKIDQFLSRLKRTAVASVDRIDAALVARESALLLDSRETWTAASRPLIDALKNEAHRPAERIVDLLVKKG